MTQFPFYQYKFYNKKNPPSYINLTCTNNLRYNNFDILQISRLRYHGKLNFRTDEMCSL